MTVLILRLFFFIELKAVVSPSMEPDLPVGSMIVVKPVDYDEITIGDDINYLLKDSNVSVTHRVIKKNDDSKMITTKGLANNNTDSPVDYENVVGKVIFCFKYIGFFLVWISSLKGKVITITFVIVLNIISAILDKYDMDKTE